MAFFLIPKNVMVTEKLNRLQCRSISFQSPSLPGYEGVGRGGQLDVGDRRVLRLLPPSPPLPTARSLGGRRRSR